MAATLTLTNPEAFSGNAVNLEKGMPKGDIMYMNLIHILNFGEASNSLRPSAPGSPAKKM
jgi:hypothetical protein